MRWPAMLRPLPLTIAAMLLLAGVKLTGLVQGLAPSTLGRPGPILAAAHAAEGAKHGAPPAAPAPLPTPMLPAGGVVPPSAMEVVPVDPGPSEAERALLLDLRSRRVALEERAQALDARDGLLKAAERRLTERIEQLAAMQTRLEKLDAARRERDEANWRGLVKTYETMRPRDAAVIFNELEQPVLMQMLDRMKEAKTAPILAAMQPERARAATAQLAQWRRRTTAEGDKG